MNNQEAINILGQYDVSNIHFYTTDGEEIPFTEWSDAIKMAISALQAQDLQPTCNQLATDCISRRTAIDALGGNKPVGDPSKMDDDDVVKMWERIRIINIINKLPSAQPYDYSDGYADGYKQGQKDAQPERLTDDDFETIRIHLNAYKEKLCNQRRWKEAEEYQRIIDRFMSFASAQPDIYEYSDKLWKAAYERGKAEARLRWIPCSERLPELDVYVIAITQWQEITMARRIGDGEWFIHEDNANAYDDDILAWMPLPEPYRP